MTDNALRFFRLQHASVYAQKKKLIAELELNLENPADRRAVIRRDKIKERLGDLDERSQRLEAKFRDARQK